MTESNTDTNTRRKYTQTHAHANTQPSQPMSRGKHICTNTRRHMYTHGKRRADTHTAVTKCKIFDFLIFFFFARAAKRRGVERSGVALRGEGKPMRGSVECGRLAIRANIMKRFSSQYWQSALKQ